MGNTRPTRVVELTLGHAYTPADRSGFGLAFADRTVEAVATMSTNGEEEMKHTARLGITLAAVAAVLCCAGCPDVLRVPAPCTSDEDCGGEITCRFPNGVDEPGICDVDETQVTTGTPAPCASDEDCGGEIACLFPNGPEEAGICDVDEMLAP